MNTTSPNQVPVAIIGIGCIFAKSNDLKAFMHLLNQGISGISDPPESHQYLADYFDPDPKKPDHIYCNRGGYLPSIEFDPTEFGIPPNTLEATDTSQLLGLVTAKKALEDAGYGESGKGFDRTKTSVILGVTGTQELVIPLGARLGHPFWQKALRDAGVPDAQATDVIQRIQDEYVSWQEHSFPGLLGNVVAGRIANRLDLGGTNCVVDAACASSMGAVHMALLELTSGRSDMVITGGVDTINDAFMHMCFSKTRILSASGDVRPFSIDADGTVLGEGVGLVVLKRLQDAERDGDRVYAVIKGIGASSDGKSQSIYAPNSEGQINALKRAYQSAGIDPTSVELVEAHGTGTRVGDQVEFKALCDVFGAVTSNGNRCALGSVKSNIGHTKAAAGTAGLIKTALSIYHKVLPPTLKADTVDPKLGVEHSPFYLNTRLRPWISKNGHKRRAGVSAFGFGGSNFHTILEEHAMEKMEPSWDGTIEMAAFSAQSRKALAGQIASWDARVRQHPTCHNIGKLANQSRRRFNRHDPHRLVMVLDLSHSLDALYQTCRHCQEHLTSDRADFQENVFYAEGGKAGQLAFLYPGQGSQYVGMGRDLICCFPQSLATFQKASSFFEGPQGLEDYVHPRMDATDPSHESRLRQTQVAQPAIGAVSLAMHRALVHFDIRPDATCGHSYGELTALCGAGWISEEDFWRLSIARGQLMADAGSLVADGGGMMAVTAPLEQIAAMAADLEETVILANRNGPQQGVLSGPLKGIEIAEKACRAKGWQTVRLPVAAAFHSPLVADAQEPFARKVATTKIVPGETPVMSNTTGIPYPQKSAEAIRLIGRQLSHPVDFISNLNTLYKQGIRTFVEVGPKSILTRLVQQAFESQSVHALAMDRSHGRRSGLMDLAYTLGHLASLGYETHLERWEKSSPVPRKARMAITLSGTNYRNPKKVPQKEPALQPATLAQQTGTDATQKRSLQNAMATIRNGLASLQALQAQTTQAHQKYLETQAEASRTLQQLIEGSHQLAGITLKDGDADFQKMALPGAASVDHQPRESKVSPQTTTISAPLANPLSVLQTEATKNHSKEHNDLTRHLMAIVSELTGYPEQMLGLDMDIEADLGIDSIKRVEILSALEEKMPHLPKVTPDLMGTLKTLGQICTYLSADQPPLPALTSDGSPKPQREMPKPQVQKPSIERRILAPAALPAITPAGRKWSSNGILGIVGVELSIGAELVAAFKTYGLTAKILTHIEELMSEEKLVALLLMAPLEAKEAFRWAKTAAPLLQHSADGGMAGLFTVSFLDGSFGLGETAIQTPEQGALAGLAKTADLEWPDVLCRALDVDPLWQDIPELCRAIAAEVAYAQANTEREIGIGPEQRLGLQLKRDEGNNPIVDLELEETDVVIVTGGARGVTAAAAMALGSHTPCRLALLGRSPAPQPEPQWLDGLNDPGEIKQALIRNLFDGQPATPAHVDAVFRQYASNREIKTVLDQLNAMGVMARYFSVDVRNPAAVETSLDIVRNDMGPIKGVIHGAGILQDRLIVDKQMTQFQQVYDTKVQGLKTILKATQSDGLRYLVLFSSVSARMGNQGQVDYAMANEVLNKMAHQQVRLRPHCKVISINWGPWDGGMVTDGLKRIFHERGVGLIPLEAGAQAMVAEMAKPNDGPIEVVLGASLQQDAAPEQSALDSESNSAAMMMTCKREIDLRYYPVLLSHQINGRPVVPLALITEWLAHSALHANPGLTLHGLDHVRLLNGITMDQQKRWVHLLAGKALRKGSHYEVDVEIRNGVADARAMIHSSAKAILTENLPAPPAFRENGHFNNTQTKHTLDEIYSHILFHGQDLRGIQKIIALSDQGMSARLSAAPPPAKWMRNPLRSNWIADPLILDCAFQMAIVWCFDRFEQVSLPSYAASYRQYCRQFPSDGVSAVMEVDKVNQHKLVCRFTFLDSNKKVMAVLEGYEAVMTPDLMQAFKAA